MLPCKEQTFVSRKLSCHGIISARDGHLPGCLLDCSTAREKALIAILLPRSLPRKSSRLTKQHNYTLHAVSATQQSLSSEAKP